MAGRIPQHFIDELVARADIIEVIGTRIPLKKAGKEYKACCPFHGEKTPSFTVVPEKQFYHCFGCGAHGTALGFLMDHDHLSFVEAVEDLAGRVGLDVPQEDNATSPPKPAEDLYGLMGKAVEYFARELRSSERAKEYLVKRGLVGETAVTFGIGYAPDAWDGVLKHLGSIEPERQKLLRVGLTIERDKPQGNHDQRGYYDRFRDRIMFPIRDARGRTIGFGGRILDQGEPKYLNSPETELFHKGRELYGLFEARQATRSIERLMVVEGYMDVVRLHQAGITYACATLGTATTSDHLIRLFRITSEVIFCFDGDRAGRAAAWRALENALSQVREGRQLKFLFLPDGHDPDSLVGEEGRAAFEERLKTALPLSEYFIKHLVEQVDIQSVDGRAKLAALARPLLGRVPQGVYRELLIDELAQVVRMAPGRLSGSLQLGNGEKPQRPDMRSDVHETLEKPGLQPHSAGRRNLVRQAIQLLVHFPAIAGTVADALIDALGTVDLPGVPLLMQLLGELKEQPCANTGALLERWRERPNSNDLAKLAMRECLAADAVTAAQELHGGLRRLTEETQPAQRREQLLTKHGIEGLSDAEKAELQGLLKARPGATSGSEKH
jgi:DNA primase